MNEYINIFISHFSKYPKMLPNDFFKLIYQNSHGPNHLNQVLIKANFTNELKSLTKPPKEQFEDIGNNYTRVYLNPKWDSTIQEAVLQAFVNSNIDYNPNSSLLFKELELLKKLILNNSINLEIESFLNDYDSYINNGPKAVSHSSQYKQNYDPHYVVIHNKYLNSVRNILEVNYEGNKKAPSLQNHKKDC